MTDRELMQMALDALESVRTTVATTKNFNMKWYDYPIKALRDRLAQPEPEPVAFYGDQPLYAKRVYANDISQERVDETSKDEHDPVAYVSGYHDGYCVVTPINPATVFSVGASFSYTAPSKREWVGLTDEEIDGWNIVGHESLREFVRAIEAKLKEKNS